MVLLHLEIWDAVAQQSTDSIIALKDGYGVTYSGELLSSCKACRTRSDDSNCLAGQAIRNAWFDEAVVERIVNDRNLNLLDGDRRLVDS